MWTNLNHLSLVLYPLLKELLPCNDTEVLQCLLIMQVILLMCIFMNHSLVNKPLMPSMHLNERQSNMEYESYTTIVIMDGLQTKILWMIFTSHIKQSHSVASVPIIKMVLLNTIFVISQKALILPCYMLLIDGPKQLQPICGLKH